MKALKTFGVICVAGAFAGSALARSAEKPNVVVIMVDDMGYGGVSCFENDNYKTPEIDRLAAEGVTLADYHSNGAVCSPTRAALMTGRYQQRSGCDAVINADPKVAMHHIGIHDQEWTFAEAMKSAGYATGIFGKWHLGYTPEYNPMNHGFDEFNGFISGNIDAHSHRDRMNVEDWWQGRERKDEPGYHTDLINQHALDFIERHQSEPFFLYVAHGTPHSPFQARGSRIQRGPNKGTLPAWAPDESYSTNPAERNWLFRHFVLPVDEGVGQIRDKLEKLGIADSTMVWFISDNGAARGNFTDSKRLRGRKGSNYEGGHRVPGIVWAPGRVKAGTVSGELILGFDIMPTAMAMAGVAAPKDHWLDGVDVGPALFRGEPLPQRRPLWSMGERGALRDGDWKLVINGGRNELYDLSTDLAESTDLAAKHPGRVTQLRSIYDTMLQDALADSPYPAPAQKERSK